MDSGYKTSDIEHDYLLITVAEDLSNYVHFSLGISYNVADIMFNRVPIYVTGVNGGDHPNTDEGRIYTSSVDNSFVMRYNTDTAGGQSGSPVYTITKQIIDGEESYVYTALAIHSYAGERDRNNPLDSDEHPIYFYNQGARMTKYLLQFYTDNPNIGYNANQK